MKLNRYALICQFTHQALQVFQVLRKSINAVDMQA